MAEVANFIDKMNNNKKNEELGDIKIMFNIKYPIKYLKKYIKIVWKERK